MPTFLHDVAAYIINKYEAVLRDSCIVFPNQRSSVYFCDELKRLNNKVIWLPKMFTIDEFIHKIGDLPYREDRQDARGKPRPQKRLSHRPHRGQDRHSVCFERQEPYWANRKR